MDCIDNFLARQLTILEFLSIISFIIDLLLGNLLLSKRASLVESHN